MQDSLGATQEKVALHLFPGRESALWTPLPGVGPCGAPKAFCTVHWQEGGSVQAELGGRPTRVPAQILGIQSRAGHSQGSAEVPEGRFRGWGRRAAPPSTDATGAFRESPQKVPWGGGCRSFSSPDASDRLLQGCRMLGTA